MIVKVQGVAESPVKRAMVIGAGAMGSGIAAQFANAGVTVDLLDVSREKAEEGIARQLKAGGFMVPEAAERINAGSLVKDMGRAKRADWIVEAIIEDLTAKQDLYKKLDKNRKPGSVVSSNTSTIQRRELLRGMSKSFAGEFVITHFFNPPRIMHLVEIVAGPDAKPSAVSVAEQACRRILGKRVITARDTPGFIANRIGCYWMAVAALEAQRLGLSAEEADAVHLAFGVPRTGVFGLFDLVGLDIVPHVWNSLLKALPKSDDIHAFNLPAHPLIVAMIEKGRLGRKAGGGFYRLTAGKRREVIDFATGEYRLCQVIHETRTVNELLKSSDARGQYAWHVLSRVVTYAAKHARKIAVTPEEVDAGMTLGYNWRHGPLALASEIGVDRIAARLQEEGRAVPADLAKLSAPKVVAAAPKRLAGNDVASLWQLADGAAQFEIHSKMNTLSPAVMDILDEALQRGGRDFSALVLTARGDHFSAGAELGGVAELIRAQNGNGLRAMILRGQTLFMQVKSAAFPIVAAANGLALGGGLELMMHAHAIVAHAELRAGLPESKIGLVPGWGGCKEMLLRVDQKKGPVAIANAAFNLIAAGVSSTSAPDLARQGVLQRSDVIVMNRDDLMSTAVARALAMRAGFTPRKPQEIIVSGPSGKAGIMARVMAGLASGKLTDTDAAIAEVLAGILTGGPDGDALRPMTEWQILALERDGLLERAEDPSTLARMEHMLASGEPLRN